MIHVPAVAGKNIKNAVCEKKNYSVMIMKNIKKIISNGEGITVEFKKSREKVTSDVYQSICDFLNRNGGQVILGVEDDGAITGIKEDAFERMKKDLVTVL